MADRIIIDFNHQDMFGPTLTELIGRDCKITYKDGQTRFGRIIRTDVCGFFTSVNDYEIYYYLSDLREIETI